MDMEHRIMFLLAGLFVTCSCAYEILLFSDPKPWAEAQSFCRESCVDLATVHDMEEMEALQHKFQDQYEVALWIGLYKGIDLNYQWSLANDRFYKEGEKTFFYSGLKPNRNCIGFKDGEPRPDHCTFMKPGICFDESKQGVEQYVLITQPRSWMGIRECCRDTHTDLASVRNPAEAQMIQNVSGGSEVWVGLFKDTWLWSDNSSSSFRFFPAGTHPFTDTDPACIAMIKDKSGRWGERSCDEALPFFCKCPRSSMRIKVTLSSTTGLDFHNSDAQQNIIKQMEQRLNQAKLTRPVSLRWTNKSESVSVKKPAAEEKDNCPFV